MEIELKDLSSRVYILKEIVDSFEYSDKTEHELISVIKLRKIFLVISYMFESKTHIY